MDIADQLIEKCSLTPSVDRISDLPDSILYHILSYIPTKLCVATSVLARRWRFVWTHVTSYDFDCLTYGFEGNLRFPEMVNRVLLMRDAYCINTFRLRFFERLSNYKLETWVGTAIARRVQVLDLHLTDQFRLPKCLFNCKTLVDLRLCNGICLPVSVAVALPNLKKLHLQYVKYENDASLPNLISGCEVLEDLIIERDLSIFDGMVCCYISSPTLKRLTLSCLAHGSYWEGFDLDYMLELNIPMLDCLHLESNLFMHITVRSLSSYVKADIRLHDDSFLEDFHYAHFMFEIVKTVSSVKFLKLSSGVMGRLSASFSAITKRFDNLIKLDLAADWHFLARLLECADNLQFLIIRQVESCPKRWREPQQVPVCLLSSLRTVSVHKFMNRERDFQMVGYIINNVRVLETMEIYSVDHDDMKAKCEVMRKLLRFRRGSRLCRIYSRYY